MGDRLDRACGVLGGSDRRHQIRKFLAGDVRFPMRPAFISQVICLPYGARMASAGP